VVLTNAHVVSTAARITVTFADGLQADARVLGLSDGLDLAVLRIDPPATLKAVALGSSGALILGEPVIAIGNPFGLGHTVTTGVISATSRALETDERVFQDFIQTDASINPGNSGGPLLNADGELIGINTAIRPDAQGIGFAIPIDRAIKVARDLVEDGVVQLPWLGILVVDVAFSFEGVQRTGPKVVTVLHHATKPATIASNGHLQAGDIILAIQSRPIQGRADMNAYLSSLTAGEPLRITALRQGKTVELEMNTDIPGDKDGLKDAAQRIGWTLEPYADQHRQIVVVTKVRPSGTAAKLGLRPGDIILGIDGRHVTLPADAQSAIQQALAKHRSTALITVQRGHAHGRVALAL
jgi:serine protease Do